MEEEQKPLPILHEPSYPARRTPFVPQGITRIGNGDATSFEEALWWVVDAYREAEENARQCGDQRWADEIQHFGALFRTDAAAFLDCYCRATWQAEDDDERLRLAVEEFGRHEGEFVTLICDALLDVTLLTCEPDELVDMWLTADPRLSVHAWPKRDHPDDFKKGT